MSNVSILLKYTSIINKFAFVGENEVLSYSRLVNKKTKFFYRLLRRQNN